MAEIEPSSHPRKKRRSLRGILRWLVRFLSLSTAVIAGILLFVTILSTILYFNRAGIINRSLAVLVAPFRVSIGDIDFHRIGEVTIRDLQLTPKNAVGETPLASIPETVITYRPRELRDTGKLGSISLRGADIVLNEDILSALSSKEKEVEEGDAPAGERFNLKSLAHFTGNFEILDSHLTVDLNSAPAMNATWQFHSGAIGFGEDGFNREAISLTLTDVSLGLEGKNGHIDRLEASGRVTPDFSSVRIDTLEIDAPKVQITPDFFPKSPPVTSAEEAEEGLAVDATGSDRPPFDLLLRSLQLNRAEISASGFDGTLPDFSFETTLPLQDLKFQRGKWSSGSPIKAVLENVIVGKGKAQLLSADRIELSAGKLETLLEEHIVPGIALHGLDVLLTDSSMASFQKKETDPTATETANPTPASSEKANPWTLSKVTLTDGTILMRDLTLGGKAGPELQASVTARLEDLHFGPDGFTSKASQTVIVENTKLRAPGATTATDPLLSIERAEMVGRWSEFQKNSLLDRLVIRGPKIEFTDATIGQWFQEEESDPETAGPADRPVYKVTDLEVTGGRLVADSSFSAGRVPKIYSEFTLATGKGEKEAPFSYHLKLNDFHIRNHTRQIDFVGPPRPPTLFPETLQPIGPTPLQEGEVITVKQIDLDFTAAQLQRTRRIGKLKMTGAVLTVGDGLKAIADTGSEDNEPAADSEPDPALPAPAPVLPEPAPVLPAPNPVLPEPASTPPSASTIPKAPPKSVPKLPTWLIEQVEITQSQVNFEALIPQVEGLRFAIETQLTDIPLSLDGILAQEKLQKIELAGIEIKDPYNSFITVAFLPTIFVEFSLAGLTRQEIEKIDLIGPSLHVGQGLFWWIDYQRKFREQNEGASIGIDAGIEVAKKPDWIIKTINATAGQIVISPTGVPIGIVPFPFNATTNMSAGNIELKLTIPDEDHVYKFPDYKVDLYGLTGDVLFNVPVKEVNNNLVQTFTLKRGVWKNYEARDLFITVTFDENGIYGKFGGAAYDGYAEGQFNFYLGDTGKWDAWISGTNMDTGPLTQVIVPDNFLMDGRLSLKVISEGRDKTVGETSGEFHTDSPGWFDVTKLDAILENLPPEWNSLQRSLTELSLIALKRFEYDKGAGSLYFLNQAGELSMRFVGDYGSRELNLHVHDERNTKSQTAAAGSVAGDEIPTKTSPKVRTLPLAPSTEVAE